MTDAENISGTDEYPKAVLEWRKVEDNYAVAKFGRGARPLPLALMLRLTGPRKILDAYAGSVKIPNESIELITYEQQQKIMQQTAKTLNFPGNNTFAINGVKVPSTATAVAKNGLPQRPALQQNFHVSGRYFSKKMVNEETDNLARRRVQSENLLDRPRTLTPRSVFISGSRASSRLTKSTGRGIYTARKSARNHFTDDQSLKSHSIVEADDSKSDLYSISFRTDKSGNYDPSSELHSDYYTIKKVKQKARHVSFPGTDADFSTILRGKPKLLHRREFSDLSELSLVKERTRMHVGFVDKD